jgi:hypothetical protein
MLSNKIFLYSFLTPAFLFSSLSPVSLQSIFLFQLLLSFLVDKLIFFLSAYN